MVNNWHVGSSKTRVFSSRPHVSFGDPIFFQSPVMGKLRWDRCSKYVLASNHRIYLSILGGELPTSRLGGAHNPGDLPMGLICGGKSSTQETGVRTNPPKRFVGWTSKYLSFYPDPTVDSCSSLVNPGHL